MVRNNIALLFALLFPLLQFLVSSSETWFFFPSQTCFAVIFLLNPPLGTPLKSYEFLISLRSKNKNRKNELQANLKK